MSDIWSDKAKETTENKGTSIPSLQPNAPVLPPPSIPSSHSSIESGGYYTLPSISRLNNSSLKFALNPIGNGINGHSSFNENQALLPGQPRGQKISSGQPSQQPQHQTQPQLHQQAQGQPQPPSQPQPQLQAPVHATSQAQQQQTQSQLPQPSGQQKPKEGPSSNGSSSQMSFYRPLNVKDALTYLDQVKHQFQTRPDVYNHFLDIMKDFKSQSIDTPGVIERVSSLFRGHPSLIQGFNTFLPPGYRIECSVDPADPNSIRVTTPLGTTTTIAEPVPKATTGDQFNNWRLQPTQGSFPSGQQLGQDSSRQNEPGKFLGQQSQDHARDSFSGEAQIEPYGGIDSHHQPLLQQQVLPHQLQQGQSSISDLQAAANRGGAIGLNERKQTGPIQFSNAINYVNKIKTRFANQPDIYKHFLEILQTYQREQKPISEVYSQVTILFQHAPDLLDDFKQFLPDTSESISSGLLSGQTPQEYYHQSGQPQLPPVGNFSAPSSGVGAPKGRDSIIVDPTKYGNKDIPTSNLRGQANPSKRRTADETSPTLVPGVPEPVEPASKVSSLAEEISFFDRVKKAIGSKQTYNEFLKMLNLYTQDIIDKDTLVERVEGFIGSSPDLFGWFKQFVGFDDKPLHIENITFKKHQLDLLLCKPYGPSYRKLPKTETYMPCSGRDEMCWEVLNDEWVGHPTWASEDSGFIAHRKNQYEEILFRIEEERHEYDFYMESNLRTIQTLETIANRIANMPTEERAKFRLPNGLGHTSQTIYKKVVRKIYGKEKGFEVIDALHNNPAIAVPVVLRRLKQKDEEWRRAHREWNKVWREMEQKVFFKSLDHLGLTFKQADKKLLTSKQLVSEISTIKLEQINKRLHPLTPKSQEQLNYDFNDDEILYDIIKLVFVFLTASSTYSSNDKERLFDFLKSFISLFFSIDNKVLEEAVGKRLNLEDGSIESSSEPEAGESAAGSASSPASATDRANSSEVEASRKRNREPDLLKDVLKKSKTNQPLREEKPDSSVSPTQGSVQTDKAAEDDEFDIPASIEAWINIGDSPKVNDTLNSERKNFNLFANTNIYIFFRHLRVLYDRLLEVKELNGEVTRDIKGRTEVEFAKDLNLISNQLTELGLEFNKESDAYTQLLALSEKVIAGDVEHQWFEESLRQAYRNRAYKLYTVDKVTQALVKHLQAIVADARSSEIFNLFEKDRNSSTTSAKDQIIYRFSVRNQMNPDENMFKITYNEPEHHVSIEFIDIDDLTLNDQKTEEEKWNYYLTSYIIAHPTEGVNVSVLKFPFTKSYSSEDFDESESEGLAKSKLAINVAKDSYKLFFVPGTGDEFTRYSLFNKTAKAKTTNVDKLRRIFDDKFTDNLGDLEEDQAKEELKYANERFDTLLVNPSKFKELLNAKAQETDSGLEGDADQDRTLEKGDETIPDASSTAIIKRANPLISSVLEQDVTVDADSTLPQDDTEIKGNDTTTEENAEPEASNVTDTSSIVTEQAKPVSDVDGDRDAKMD